MSVYDEEYYFIEKSEKSDELPSLTPDENTESRDFRFSQQPIGSSPLVFFNGAKEYNDKRGIKGLKVPPEILFSGSNLVVSSNIRNSLLSFNIPNLHFHLAIYIHDDNKWYEDYWYMTFSNNFDCWDRENSSYEDEPLELGGFNLYSVYTYSLNDELLEKTTLKDRLIFKMGGTQDGYIVCHETISHLFSKKDGGAKLTRISDY